MKKMFAGVVAGLVAGAALAHVPYIERADYTPAEPFVVVDPPHSIAVYGWLQGSNDLDVFTMNITNVTEVFAEILVPVAPTYANFFPKFAVVGPGLPAPKQPLPFTLQPGYGAVVVDYASTNRPVEFEPFGGKFYFYGPEFDETVSATGTWQIVVWDPQGRRGDYVLAVGREETFSGPDFVRAIVNTKIIRENGELHIPAVNMKPRGK